MPSKSYVIPLAESAFSNPTQSRVGNDITPQEMFFDGKYQTS